MELNSRSRYPSIESIRVIDCRRIRFLRSVTTTHSRPKRSSENNALDAIKPSVQLPTRCGPTSLGGAWSRRRKITEGVQPSIDQPLLGERLKTGILSRIILGLIAGFVGSKRGRTAESCWDSCVAPTSLRMTPRSWPLLGSMPSAPIDKPRSRSTSEPTGGTIVHQKTLPIRRAPPRPGDPAMAMLYHLHAPSLLIRARALATVREWKKRLEDQAHSRSVGRVGCGLPVTTGRRCEPTPVTPQYAAFATYKAARIYYACRRTSAQKGCTSMTNRATLFQTRRLFRPKGG